MAIAERRGRGGGGRGGGRASPGRGPMGSGGGVAACRGSGNRLSPPGAENRRCERQVRAAVQVGEPPNRLHGEHPPFPPLSAPPPSKAAAPPPWRVLLPPNSSPVPLPCSLPPRRTDAPPCGPGCSSRSKCPRFLPHGDPPPSRLHLLSHF